MPDVLITDEAKVRWITLNRPETRNALTTGLNQAVIAAVDGAEAAGARVVVLTGAGGAFSSGLDLRVAAEEDGLQPLLDELVDAGFNRRAGAGGVLRQRHVAAVHQEPAAQDIVATLVVGVAGG